MPKFSAVIFTVLLFMGLTGGFWANMRPIWCNLNGQNHWPLLETIFFGDNRKYQDMDDQNAWQKMPPSDRIMPIIPFNAVRTSPDRNLPPGSSVNGLYHWLGTDELGRDVMAGVVTGTKTALFTALLALLVTFLAGGILGAIAGYFGDDRLQTNIRHVVLALTVLSIVLFWVFISRQPGLHLKNIVAITLLCGAAIITGRLLKKLKWGDKKIGLPADTLIMRFADVFESVPVMILLIVSVSVIKDRTLTKVIVLIGLLSWTGMARLLRSELLKVRQADYISAVRQLGVPEWRILLRHAIPNAIRPVLLMFALSASAAILIESGLSFLNLSSNDITVITWGKLLQTARNNIEYWWVWVPPGTLLALTTAAFFEWKESKFS